MSRTRKIPEDFDSPWKEALRRFLKPFLAFFFADIEAGIDWSRGYEALDKEFQQIIRRAAVGKLFADMLFKVWLRDGSERWLLIHVEIQGDYDVDLPERIFDYHLAIRRLYNRTVVSLAVLCDDRPDWRPGQFGYEQWGCKLELTFPVAKLLDFADREEHLEANDNPFSAVVLAHLKALQTRRDPATRRHWKLQLVKGLYERNWTAEDVRQLFRLIDWVMDLPEELQEQFRVDVHNYEEEKKMPYLSSIERLALKEGMEKGREEGREEGRQEGREEGYRKAILESVAWDLNDKFGPPGRKLLPKIRAVQDVKQLRSLARRIKTAKTLSELRRRLP